MELGSDCSLELPQLLSGHACMKWRSLRAPLLNNDMSLMAMQCMRTTSSTQNLNHSSSEHLHESCAFLLLKPHLRMSHSEGMQSAKSCCRQTLLLAPSFCALPWLQEVVGDDRSALQAVVAADTELMELREEEEEINAKLQDITLDDKTFDADEASERLNEVSLGGSGFSLRNSIAAVRGSVRAL